jgi:hypothetical protein
MAKHYPVEQRERAVKMVLDHLQEVSVGVCRLPVDRPECRRRYGIAAAMGVAGPGRTRPTARCHKVLRVGLKIRSRRATRNAAAGCMFQL